MEKDAKENRGKITKESNKKPAKENKKNTTLKRITLGSLLAVIFALLYIPSLYNWLSGDNISRDIIRIGIIEEAVKADGIIIRDEELLQPPAIGGRYIPLIGEGEKTAAFSRIATVLNSKSDTMLQEVEELNAKILKARMEKAEKAEFFSEDLVKLNKEIGLQVRNLISACNSRSFEELGRYRSEIGRIVEKKAEIVGESSTDSYINSLIQQKETIQEKINKNTVQLTSEISGIVSYTIDGYEDLLTPEGLSEITPELLESVKPDNMHNQENSGMAFAGKPLAKIIKGTDIYIAAALESKKAERYKAGDKIKLRINDIGMETTAVVANINRTNDGKTVVVVRASRGTDVLSSKRCVDVDFINKTEKGFKVPLRCLMDISQDGLKAKIMLIKYNVSVSRAVDIICRDEEYAIIRSAEKEINKSVNLYDTYIINPEKINEGKIIEK